MPLSASELRRAFPCDGPDLPPQIEMFRNLDLTFEVQQPGRPRPGSFADFRISKIIDLPASFGPRKARSFGHYLPVVGGSPQDRFLNVSVCLFQGFFYLFSHPYCFACRAPGGSSQVLGSPSVQLIQGSSPSLGVGSLSLASPPATNLNPTPGKQTGLPCSHQDVLPTPEKEPTLPR
ncbi:hypothetical protein LINGRAHAP2_LOCUS9958 [Linum grandiflorum]